jgi:Family of unknown function (DUF5681)
MREEMAKSKRAQNSERNSVKKRPPPEAIAKFCFKPGQSGNPGGRPRKKPLTDMLIQFLEQVDPKDKKGRQFAQILIREWYQRAVTTSDHLLIEMLNRIEGRLAPESIEERQADVQPITVIHGPSPAAWHAVDPLSHGRQRQTTARSQRQEFARHRSAPCGVPLIR